MVSSSHRHSICGMDPAAAENERRHIIDELRRSGIDADELTAEQFHNFAHQEYEQQSRTMSKLRKYRTEVVEIKVPRGAPRFTGKRDEGRRYGYAYDPDDEMWESSEEEEEDEEEEDEEEGEDEEEVDEEFYEAAEAEGEPDGEEQAQRAPELAAYAFMIPAEELERRREAAIELLREAKVDPETLTPDQLNIFLNQSPTLQAESLKMFAEYGAERLRIVLPDSRFLSNQKRQRSKSDICQGQASKRVKQAETESSDFPNVDATRESSGQEDLDDTNEDTIEDNEEEDVSENERGEEEGGEEGQQEGSGGEGKESEEVPIDWHPAKLFRKPTGETQTQSSVLPDKFGLVILNQPLSHFTALRRLWNNAQTHVAADGGANCLYEAGPAKGEHIFDNLQVIIGDLDSLRDDVKSYFSSPPRHAEIIHKPSQYATDFTKAVEHIRAHHPSKDIVVLGGLGGRVDQGLSQLHHLYLFQKDPGYAAGRVYLVSEESITFLLKSGRHRIRVRDDGGEEEIFEKHVGILPIREPSRISTKGLEWDVEDWPTEFGGQVSTSNHVLPETEVVEVMTTKDVLFTIAVRQLD